MPVFKVKDYKMVDGEKVKKTKEEYNNLTKDNSSYQKELVMELKYGTLNVII